MHAVVNFLTSLVSSMVNFSSSVEREPHAGNVVNFMTSRQFIKSLVTFVPPQWQVKKMTNLSYPNSGQLQSNNHLSLHIQI